MELQEELASFYNHYDPEHPADQKMLDGLAKQYAGKERELWTDLFNHYDPTNVPTDEMWDKHYVSITNSYAKKKGELQGGSPDSGVDSKTGLQNTKTVEPVIPQVEPVVASVETQAPMSGVLQNTPVEIKFGGEVFGLNKPGEFPATPKEKPWWEEMRSANEIAGKAQLANEIKVETAAALRSLADDIGYPKMTEHWGKQVQEILDDPTKSAPERDVLAMRYAYNTFKNMGVERGIDPTLQSDESSALNTAIDVTKEVAFGVGGLMTEGAIKVGDPQGVAMEKVWQRLAEAEDRMRMEDPVGWNKLQETDKINNFRKLYPSRPEEMGTASLLFEAIDNQSAGLSTSPLGAGGMYKEGLPENYANIRPEYWEGADDEARLRLNIVGIDHQLRAIPEAARNTPAFRELKAQGQVLQDKADALKNARLQGLSTRMEDLRKYLSDPNLDEQKKRLGFKALSEMQDEYQGFIDPDYQIQQAVAANKEEIKEATGGKGTLQEQLMKYYSNLLWERKQLAARIHPEGLSVAGEVANVSREIGGPILKGWNKDELRLEELDNKIQSLGPVVLLNMAPTGGGGNFFVAAGKSALNTASGGAGALSKIAYTGNDQSAANDINEMLMVAGVDPKKVINPGYQPKFNKQLEGADWLSWEHMGELGGMLGVMAAQSSVGGSALKAVGIEKLIASMTANLAKGGSATAAKIFLNALAHGASYEITGDLFPSQEHFFSFTNGVVGGVAGGGSKIFLSSIGKGVQKGMVKSVSTLFGNKGEEAVKWITNLGKNAEEGRWFVPQAGTTLDKLRPEGMLSKGIGGVAGQAGEGMSRQLSETGGGGTLAPIEGLVKIFQDSNVRAEYMHDLENQFGHTFKDRSKFFLDMFVLGAFMPGHAKDGGLRNEILEQARETYESLTPEEQAEVTPVIESFNELDDVHNSTIEQVSMDENSLSPEVSWDVEQSNEKPSGEGVAPTHGVATIEVGIPVTEAQSTTGEAEMREFIDGTRKAFDIKENGDGTVVVSVLEGTTAKAGTEVQLTPEEKAKLDAINKGAEDGTRSKSDAIDQRRELATEAFNRQLESTKEATTNSESVDSEYEGKYKAAESVAIHLEEQADKAKEEETVVTETPVTETKTQRRAREWREKEQGVFGKPQSEAPKSEAQTPETPKSETTSEITQDKNGAPAPKADAPVAYSGNEIHKIDKSNMSPVQKKVLGDVGRVVKAIGKLVKKATGKDVEVKIHTSPETYEKSVIDAGGTVSDAKGSKGFYMASDGHIHLNMEDVSSETMLHEGFHPVLDYMAKNNPEILDSLHSQLLGIEGGKKISKQAGESYGTEDKVQHYKEAITDFISKVADGSFKLSRTNFEKVKGFVVDTLKKLGLPLDKDIANISDLRELANEISSKFNKGEEIGVKDGKTSESNPQFSKGDIYDRLRNEVDRWRSDGDTEAEIEEALREIASDGTIDEAKIKDLMSPPAQETPKPKEKTTTNWGNPALGVSNMIGNFLNRAGTSMSELVGQIKATYEKQSHKAMHKEAMQALGSDPLSQLDDVIDGIVDGRKYNINDYATILSRRVVMVDVLSHTLDKLRSVMNETTDLAEKEAIRKQIEYLDKQTLKLLEVTKNQATIGGQGISFLDFTRSVYENAASLVQAHIDEYNKNFSKKKSQVAKTKDAKTRLNEARQKSIDDTVNSMDDIIDNATGGTPSTKKSKGSAKPKPKPLSTLVKTLSAAQLGTVAKNFAKAAGIQFSRTEKSKPQFSAKSDVEAAMDEIAVYGTALVGDGFVKYSDWAKQFRQELPSVSDHDLNLFWNHAKYKGMPIRQHAEVELAKAAKAPSSKAAKAPTLRSIVQAEFRNGDPSDIEGLKKRLVNDHGFSKQEADYLTEKGADALAKRSEILEKKREIDAEKASKRTIDAERRRIASLGAAITAPEKPNGKAQGQETMRQAVRREFMATAIETLEQRLIDNVGLTPTEANELVTSRAEEINKRVEQLKERTIDAERRRELQLIAAMEPSAPSAKGQPSERTKIQQEIAANDPSTLEERLQTKAGLTKEEARFVMDNAKDAMDRSKVAAEKKAISDAGKQAVREHFSKSGLETLAAEYLLSDEMKAAEKEVADNEKARKDVKMLDQRGKLVPQELRDKADAVLSQETLDKAELARTARAKAKKMAAIAKNKLNDGRFVDVDLLVELAEKSEVEMPEAELRDLAEKMINHRDMTLEERIAANSPGMSDQDVGRVADLVRDEFDRRMRGRVDTWVKSMKGKGKVDRVGRAKTDVDRALEVLSNEDITDEDVNEIFRDRLGMAEDLTPEQLAELREMQSALTKAKPGSILELDAARNMDRYFDAVLPKSSFGRSFFDMAKALAYAGMLSGISTSAKNILSAGTIVALAPAVNFLNLSKWARAVMDGGKYKSLGAFIRSSPIMETAVKYRQMVRQTGQARRLASDAMMNGFIDAKFLEGGNSPFGRNMSALERRAYKSFSEMDTWARKWQWTQKYVGRALQAQDVFLRTVAYEMEVADAVRRENLGTSSPKELAKLGFKGNYYQWINQQMSENNPVFKDAVNQAITEVMDHADKVGGLSEADTRRFVKIRTQEIVNEKLPITEKARENADAMARSQIFTHKRHGVYSRMTDAIGSAMRLKFSNDSGVTVGDIFYPLAPFTTIIGNLSDTMLDYSPFSGIARANGVSVSEVLGQFAKDKEGARVGSRLPRLEDESWVNYRLRTAFTDAKDAKYYDQMGKAWLGVATTLGLSMMIGSPTKGLWFTADDDERPYQMLWDGNPIPGMPSYKDLPIVGSAMATMAYWAAYEKHHKGDDKDMAARLFYTIYGAETIAGKASVAEGMLRVVDIASSGLEFATGNPDPWKKYDPGTTMEGLFTKSIQPFIMVPTKAFPWRSSLVEQIAQVWDPKAYSKSTLAQSLEYALCGAAYRLGLPEKVGITEEPRIVQIDVWGDEIKRLPGEDTFGFLHDYVNDVANRPWVKFCNDRNITFGPTPNRTMKWDDADAIMGITFEKFTPEQFAEFCKESGKIFKADVTKFIGNEAEVEKYDKELTVYGNRVMTMTERKIKEKLSDARSMAKLMIQAKYPVSGETVEGSVPPSIKPKSNSRQPKRPGGGGGRPKRPR